MRAAGLAPERVIVAIEKGIASALVKMTDMPDVKLDEEPRQSLAKEIAELRAAGMRPDDIRRSLGRAARDRLEPLLLKIEDQEDQEEEALDEPTNPAPDGLEAALAASRAGL